VWYLQNWNYRNSMKIKKNLRSQNKYSKNQTENYTNKLKQSPMTIKPSLKWTLWRTKAIEDAIIKIPDADFNKKKI
jgi:hypothetical protein